MRTTIAIATFLAVGAGAAGVSALNLKGSDTLKATTLALLHDATLTCGGVGNTPAGSLDYDGTGSGNGQAFILDPNSGQFIAPMSRALNNGAGICTNANRTKAEGIVFELDGISIMARGAVASSCNGANSPNCTPSPTGLAFDGTIPLPAVSCTQDSDCNDPTRPGIFGETCSGGQCTYTINSAGNPAPWKNVLRILFFGMSEAPPASGNTSLAHRNCVSPERKALQANYYQLFEGACSGHGATCTGIQHLFRRNDESGTSDLFIGAVSAGSIGQADNTVAFCNAGTVGPAWGTEVHSNGDTCTPANGGTPQSGCASGATCVTANNGIHHCEARQTCTQDSDCGAAPGAFITTGGCTANDSDCRGVPTKACSANPISGGSKICVASRLFLACNVDADCGAGLTNACVADAGSVTGKSCIKGMTGQLAASTFDAFMPAAPNSRPRNPLYNISEDPEVTGGYRGEYFTDYQDRDTLRVLCDPNEDVCSARGDLGLLLPITDVPDDAGQPSEVFPTNNCTSGRFTCSPVSQPRLDFSSLANAVYENCPDGGDPNKGAGGCPKGFCPIPITSAALGNSPICNAPANTNTTQKVQAYQGKVYNLTSWKANGSSFAKISFNRATGFGNPPHVLASDSPVNMVGAFFKIHNVHVMANANGAPTCHTNSATEQIGCLVQASPCSIGYAGNSAASVGSDPLALKVNQIDPNNLCVQNFLTLGPNNTATYRLSRRLYLNTLTGFENLGAESSDQLTMANCFANGNAAAKATGLGFIQLPAQIGGVNIGAYCEDFNEQSVCGDASNVDACKAAGQTNPAPIPGCELNLNATPPTADNPATAGCIYGGR
ncbi:MAG TPA: hypothetical protein VHC69_11910 [Polyangiaceae bacterium]|nr:hypothetical protein [Polyangiaceae bacterium]